LDRDNYTFYATPFFVKSNILKFTEIYHFEVVAKLML